MSTPVRRYLISNPSALFGAGTVILCRSETHR
jgi:hypothetical protein